MRKTVDRRVKQLEQGVDTAISAESAADNWPGSAAKLRETDDPGVIHSALLDLLRQVHLCTLEILKTAERAGRTEVVLQSIREARSNVELLARLTGQVGDKPAVHSPVLVIVSSPPQPADGNSVPGLGKLIDL
jgi:hypothetical protein